MFGNSHRDKPLTPASHFSTRVAFLPKRQPKAPRITVSRLAYAQMNLYVEIAKEEVGWMGTVKRLENGDFLIEKCFLFSQKVHATETEISNEGFSELSMELLDGVVEDTDEADWDVNKLRFWGHSHVYMGTSPSMTDEQTMLNDYGTGRSSNTGQSRFCFEDSGYPWVIRGIFNKPGEALFSVFLFEEGYRFDNVEWTVEEPTAEQIAFHKAADLKAAEERRRAQSISWVQQIRQADSDQVASPAEAKEAKDGMEGEAGKVASDATAGKGVVIVKSDAATADDTVVGDRSVLGNMRMPGDSSIPKFGRPAQAETPRYGSGGGFFGSRSFFEQPRDMKYRPDITPELRASVQADFDKKVTSRTSVTSWWGGGRSNSFGGDNAGSDQFGRNGAGSGYGRDSAGPGRFGRDSSGPIPSVSRDTVGGGDAERVEPVSAEDAEREAGLLAMAHASACFPAGTGVDADGSDQSRPSLASGPATAGIARPRSSQCGPWAKEPVPGAGDAAPRSEPARRVLPSAVPVHKPVRDAGAKNDAPGIIASIINLFKS